MALLSQIAKSQGAQLFSMEIVVTKGDQSWQVNAIPAGKAPCESPVSLGGILPTRDTPLLPLESLSLYLPNHLI